MEHRQLGASGPSSSKIAFGAMALTGAYGPVSEREAFATLERAREVGITHIDTAEVYGHGANERMVGRAVRSYRDEVVLATKFNFRQYARADRPWPELVRRSIEGSLRRLGVAQVDLWYLHRVPTDRPIEETWAPLAQAVQDGLVRYLGISEASAATIRRAHAVHPITALQSEWSLLTREVEREISPRFANSGSGSWPTARSRGACSVAGSVVPAMRASIMARPDTPITSVATVASLIPASSNV